MLVAINNSKSPICIQTPVRLRVGSEGNELPPGYSVTLPMSIGTDITFLSDEGECFVRIIFGRVEEVKMSGTLKLTYNYKERKLVFSSDEDRL